MVNCKTFTKTINAKDGSYHCVNWVLMLFSSVTIASLTTNETGSWRPSATQNLKVKFDLDSTIQNLKTEIIDSVEQHVNIVVEKND